MIWSTAAFPRRLRCGLDREPPHPPYPPLLRGEGEGGEVNPYFSPFPSLPPNGGREGERPCPTRVRTSGCVSQQALPCSALLFVTAPLKCLGGEKPCALNGAKPWVEP